MVLATGTFLGATLFRGDERWQGGRVGERGRDCAGRASSRELGLGQGRLKTGTPPRLDGRTIDWARCAPQPSDRERWTHVGARPPARAAAAAAPARSPAPTRDAMTSSAPGFDRSPLFAGAIEGRGPRYCPSIEDKVQRFGDRDGHQIFLEPEGLDDRTRLSQRHFDLAARRTSSRRFVRSDRRA